jgi:hypothetical protein
MNELEKRVWAATVSYVLLQEDETVDAIDEADAQVKDLREHIKINGRLHEDDDLEAERLAEEKDVQGS